MMQPFLASGKNLMRILGIVCALAMLASPCAYAQELTVTHSGPATYAAEEEVTVTMEVAYTGDVTALGMQVTLPSGWTYVSRAPVGDEFDDMPSAKSDDMPAGVDIEFNWQTIPASPISFKYIAKAGTCGDVEISTKALYRRLGGEEQAFAEPNPMPIAGPTCPVVEDCEVTVTQTGADEYRPGSEYTVTSQIVYTEDQSKPITALGVQLDVPANWQYVSVGGDDAPSVKGLDNGDLEFYWEVDGGETPPVSPIDFTYTLRPPVWGSGDQTLTAKTLYRCGPDGEEQETQSLITTSPIYSLDVTHTSGAYVTGSNLLVSTRVDYTGFLTALGLEVTLPENWEFVGYDQTKPDAPSDAKDLGGGKIEFPWTNVPTTPVDFTYTVKAMGTTGTQQIAAKALYRQGAGEEQTATATPLDVPEDTAGQTLTVTHSATDYVPGANLTVAMQITYSGGLSALGIDVDLPAGWEYVSHGGEDRPGNGKSTESGAEFAWTGAPASPVDFTYIVKVPGNATGEQSISAKVLYRHGAGEELDKMATPDPLVVEGEADCTLDPEHVANSPEYEIKNLPVSVNIATSFAYTCSVTSLGMMVELPDGVTYASVSGDDAPTVKELDNGNLEFFWGEAGIPATPINFTYAVTLPEGTVGTQTINATVLYRHDAGAEQTRDLDSVMIKEKTVTPPTQDYYLITATAGENGSIDPAGTIAVLEGGSQTFTITPNAGYKIDGFKIDETSTDPTYTYTFSPVWNDHTISVTFIEATPEWCANTSWEPEVGGSITVDKETRTAKIISKNGYAIKDVLVNDISVGVVPTYTFPTDKTARSDWWPDVDPGGATGDDDDDDATEPCEDDIHAIFEAEEQITVQPTTNGDVTVEKNSDDSTTIVVLADSGFEVADVIIDGVSMGPLTEYTFDDEDAHTVEVNFVPVAEMHLITVTYGLGGIVTPGTREVKDGDDKTFTIEPKDTHQIMDVMVDGNIVTIGDDNTYTFENVVAAHTLHVLFEEKPKQIIVTTDPADGSGGIIRLEDLTATILPADGYEVKEVQVDGIAQTPLRATYTFPDGTTTGTIHAIFQDSPVAIAAMDDAEAVIAVNADGTRTVTIMPEQGYDVKTITLNGVDVAGVKVGLNTVFTIPADTPDPQVEVTLEVVNPAQYVITATAGSHGSIFPAGNVTVREGSNQTFTFTPNSGYAVLNVRVNGTSIGALTSFEFTNVLANHTIAVTFVRTLCITPTWEPTEGGKIVVEGLKATIIPAEGYEVEDVRVADVSVGSVSTYTFPAECGCAQGKSGRADDDWWPTTDPSGDDATTGDDDDDATTGDDTTGDDTTGDDTTGDDTTGDDDDWWPNTDPSGDDDDDDATTGDDDDDATTGDDDDDATTGDDDDDATTGDDDDDATTGDDDDDATTGDDDDDDTAPNMCNIHAVFKLSPVIIEPVPEEQGTVSVTSDEEGRKVITIDPKEGYELDTILVDGDEVQPQLVDGLLTYTLPADTGAVTVKVTFKEIDPPVEYTIIASSGVNGSISPSGSVKVKEGESQRFFIQPTSGYMVLDVQVDGQSIGARAQYTFTDVRANHEINVTFRTQPVVLHIITATVSGGGLIVPSDQVTVPDGDAQTFEISPAAGYEIADVKVNGESVGAVAVYTFAGVFRDATIEAIFSPVCQITATWNPDDAGKIVVEEMTATVVPNQGYAISDVLVNGESVGAITVYNFDDKTARSDWWPDTDPAEGDDDDDDAAPGDDDDDAVGDDDDDDDDVTCSHTIHAEFVATPIAVTPTENGAVTVVKTETGANVAIIAPEQGYEVDEVRVDGVVVELVGNSYTFADDAEHTIEVTFKEAVGVNYTITASAGANGSIDPSNLVIVKEGESQTFTITADDGYEVKDVVVNGESKGALNAYTFSDVAANATIHVTFQEDYFTITTGAGSGGSITPAGDVTVDRGSSLEFTITPDEGCEISDVLVDDVSVGAVASFMFDSVVANHTISAAFECVGAYTISVLTGSNGTIEPSEDVQVQEGDSQAFTITADEGYAILDVFVDDVSIGAVSSYTFENVTAEHRIEAIFAEMITIAIPTVEGGTISPSGQVTVASGSSLTLTVTPDTGYRVVEMTVDGQVVELVENAYTITNIIGAPDIQVVFEPVPTYTIAVSVGENGSMNPAGDVEVTEGGNLTFEISADPGYRLLDFLLDGIAVEIVDNTYVLSNVQSGHSVDVTFEEIPGPNTPELIDPFDGETAVFFTPTLRIEGYVHPEGVAQAWTIFKIATDVAMEDMVFSMTKSSGDMTMLDVPEFVLNGTIDYYWSAQVADVNNRVSEWADSSVFTTMASDGGIDYADTNADGIPDSQKADSPFPGVSWVVNTAVGNAIKGLEAVSANIQRFVSLKAVGPTQIVDLPESTLFPLGFIAFGLECTVGATVTVDVHMSRPAPVNARWYYYNQMTQVTSIYSRATFNADRDIVRLTLTDGGEGDADGQANGIILDPSGYGVPDIPPHTVTVVVGANGSVSPSGAVEVSDGGSQTFIITPNSGYEVLDVVMDGISQGALTTYTIENVNDSHTIVVSFQQIVEPQDDEGPGDDNCFITTAGGSTSHSLSVGPSLMLVLMALGAALFVRKVRK